MSDRHSSFPILLAIGDLRERLVHKDRHLPLVTNLLCWPGPIDRLAGSGIAMDTTAAKRGRLGPSAHKNCAYDEMVHLHEGLFTGSPTFADIRRADTVNPNGFVLFLLGFMFDRQFEQSTPNPTH